jgi:hypothetical protein
MVSQEPKTASARFASHANASWLESISSGGSPIAFRNAFSCFVSATASMQRSCWGFGGASRAGAATQDS